jgi:hypothetical protein
MLPWKINVDNFLCVCVETACRISAVTDIVCDIAIRKRPSIFFIYIYSIIHINIKSLTRLDVAQFTVDLIIKSAEIRCQTYRFHSGKKVTPNEIFVAKLSG